MKLPIQQISDDQFDELWDLAEKGGVYIMDLGSEGESYEECKRIVEEAIKEQQESLLKEKIGD